MQFTDGLTRVLMNHTLIPSSGNYVRACFSSGFPYSETASSRPVAAAALAIPDLATLIFSAYCNGCQTHHLVELLLHQLDVERAADQRGKIEINI
jgi:hypothetical protein